MCSNMLMSPAFLYLHVPCANKLCNYAMIAFDMQVHAHTAPPLLCQGHSCSISEASLTDSNSMSKGLGLRQKLQESWTAKHKLVRHSQQQPISFTPKQLKEMHQTSKCFNAGFCFCKNSEKSVRRNHEDAICFRDHLVTLMKKKHL